MSTWELGLNAITSALRNDIFHQSQWGVIDARCFAKTMQNPEGYGFLKLIQSTRKSREIMNLPVLAVTDQFIAAFAGHVRHKNIHDLPAVILFSKL